MPPRLFGSSLHDLVLDEKRCAHAKVEARIGVPSQVLGMIRILQQFLDTPSLFKKKVKLATTQALRADLEEEIGVKVGTEVHAVAGCLIQWVN